MFTTSVIAVTGAALLLGAFLWFGLWLRHGKRPFTSRVLVAMLLGAGLLCRVAFVFFTPVFYAPDEESHFNYVKYLAERHALPVATTKMGDPANEWEYFQPPLYYLGLVPVYRLTEILVHDQGVMLRVLRCGSVLLWLVNVWCAGVLLKRLKIEDGFARVFVFATVCLLPTYTFISSAVNNDNLLATLGGVTVCLMARREQTIRTSLALGWVLGMALLTKQSALVLLPAIVLWRVLECRRRGSEWNATFQQLAVALGLAVLLYAPWALRNWRVYGTLTPENLSATELVWPSLLHGLASAGHNLVKTFWAVSGISNDVGYPFPLLGMGLMVLWFVGTQTGLQPAQRPDALSWKANGPLLTALFLTTFVSALLVLRFGYQFGMGQGRHLFFLLQPIALLFVAGLQSLPVKHLKIHAAGFWITYATGFTACSLSRFP